MLTLFTILSKTADPQARSAALAALRACGSCTSLQICYFLGMHRMGNSWPKPNTENRKQLAENRIAENYIVYIFFKYRLYFFFYYCHCHGCASVVELNHYGNTYNHYNGSIQRCCTGFCCLSISSNYSVILFGLKTKPNTKPNTHFQPFSAEYYSVPNIRCITTACCRKRYATVNSNPRYNGSSHSCINKIKYSVLLLTETNTFLQR